MPPPEPEPAGKDELELELTEIDRVASLSSKENGEVQGQSGQAFQD